MRSQRSQAIVCADDRSALQLATVVWLSEERTGREHRLSSSFQTHQLWYRRAENVEIEETDPRLCSFESRRLYGRQRECEIDCKEGLQGASQSVIEDILICAGFEATQLCLGRSESYQPFQDVPATLLLPTPPFPLLTTTTFLTPGSFRFCGSPRCIRGIVGGALFLGRPCGTQGVSQGTPFK